MQPVRLSGVSVSNSKYTPGTLRSYDDSSAIACKFCALSILDSEFEDIETLIVYVTNGIALRSEHTTCSPASGPLLLDTNRIATGGGLGSVIQRSWEQ